jgi:hypothetical protein
MESKWFATPVSHSSPAVAGRFQKRLLMAGSLGVIVSVVMIALSKGALAADYSTPTAALRSLESAYSAKDIEAAVAARDFTAEAREMLGSLERENPKLKTDSDMLKELAHVLELGYRNEIASNGFPDMSGLKCEAAEESAIREDLVPIREVCKWPDGSASNEVVYAIRTASGWKIVNLPGRK